MHHINLDSGHIGYWQYWAYNTNLVKMVTIFSSYAMKNLIWNANSLTRTFVISKAGICDARFA